MSSETNSLDLTDDGEVRLPADIADRWRDSGVQTVDCLDLGDAVLLTPSFAELRRSLLTAIDDAVWAEAATGFGDPDLASE